VLKGILIINKGNQVSPRGSGPSYLFEAQFHSIQVEISNIFTKYVYVQSCNELWFGKGFFYEWKIQYGNH